MEETVGAGGVGEGDKKGITWAQFLHEAAVECFRRGAVQNFEQFEQLTPREYGVLIDAWELSDIDKDYRAAQAAWLNARAQDKKRVGREVRYVYTDFKGFFDYEKQEKQTKKKHRVNEGFEKPGSERLRKLSQFIAKQSKETGKEE